MRGEPPSRTRRLPPGERQLHPRESQQSREVCGRAGCCGRRGGDPRCAPPPIGVCRRARCCGRTSRCSGRGGSRTCAWCCCPASSSSSSSAYRQPPHQSTHPTGPAQPGSSSSRPGPEASSSRLVALRLAGAVLGWDRDRGAAAGGDALPLTCFPLAWRGSCWWRRSSSRPTRTGAPTAGLPTTASARYAVACAGAADPGYSQTWVRKGGVCSTEPRVLSDDLGNEEECVGARRGACASSLVVAQAKNRVKGLW